jgi:hypothetical protein
VNGLLSQAYAQSIYKRFFFYGEWDYNLDWKRITFPLSLAFSCTKGHKVANSKYKTPVLVMHSSASAEVSTFREEAMSTDIVLDVNNIKNRRKIG